MDSDKLEKFLDDSFKFLFEFAKSIPFRFQKSENNDQFDIWMQYLGSPEITGIKEKRSRNIYFVHLLICLLKNDLIPPFNTCPCTGDLPNAASIFGETYTDIVEPLWLDTIVDIGDDFTHRTNDGRTYVATRTMADGKGAFGYVAVSLDDGKPQWSRMQMCEEEDMEKVGQGCANVEKILQSRKHPEERQRIMIFYDRLIRAIDDEINGVVALGSGRAVNYLVEQLINELQAKGQCERFSCMTESCARKELLIMLKDRLVARRDKIRKREEYLDNIESKVRPESFWNISFRTEELYKENKTAFAPQMWEQAINSGPKQRYVDQLELEYPVVLVERFLQLLAKEKEKIAVVCQRRHENMISQMKRELRKENEMGQKRCIEVKNTLDEILDVLDNVREAEQKSWEIQRKRDKMNRDERKKDAQTEEMKTMLVETQIEVEEEAERGKILSEAINELVEQNDMYKKVNEQSLQVLRDANNVLLQNVKKLAKHIRNQERRAANLQEDINAAVKDKPIGEGDGVCFKKPVPCAAQN